MLCYFLYWPLFFSWLPRIPLHLVFLLIFRVSSTCEFFVQPSCHLLKSFSLCDSPPASQPVPWLFSLSYSVPNYSLNLSHCVRPCFGVQSIPGHNTRHCMLEIVVWLKQGLHKKHSIVVKKNSKLCSHYLMISGKWQYKNSALFHTDLVYHNSPTRHQELVVCWVVNIIWTGTTLLLKTWELEFCSHTAALWKSALIQPIQLVIICH